MLVKRLRGLWRRKRKRLRRFDMNRENGGDEKIEIWPRPDEAPKLEGRSELAPIWMTKGDLLLAMRIVYLNYQYQDVKDEANPDPFGEYDDDLRQFDPARIEAVLKKMDIEPKQLWESTRGSWTRFVGKLTIFKAVRESRPYNAMNYFKPVNENLMKFLHAIQKGPPHGLSVHDFLVDPSEDSAPS